MEHSKHLWRAGILLGIALLGGIGARHFLVPPSFGEQGFYRYDSLKEYMAQEPAHGSPAACGVCHADKLAARAEGRHATVSCEVCHAPMAVHAKDGVKIAEMPTNKAASLCAYCHQKLQARPKTQPQVNLKEHLKTLGVELENNQIPDGTCFTCHDVHSPQSTKSEPAAPANANPPASAPPVAPSSANPPESKPAPAAAAPDANPAPAPTSPSPETNPNAGTAPQKSEGAA